MGRKLRISEPAPGWRQVGKEEGGERKEETNWPCERPVWLKGARPTHCRAQDGAWGEAARAEPSRGHFTCWRTKVFIAAMRGTKE